MGLCNRVDQEIAAEGEPPKVSLETIGLEVSLGRSGDTRGHSDPALRYAFQFRSWRMIGRGGTRRATVLNPARAKVEA